MSKIKYISSREILSSNGLPTIECLVSLESGSVGVAAVPAGVSVGSYEAVELRDGDPERFWGMGAKNAVTTVNTIIAPKLFGIEAANQQEIDKLMIELDGTPQKKKLGANSILAVSTASLKAAAMEKRLPLFAYVAQLAKTKVPGGQFQIPVPMILLLEGGQHGSSNLNFQEFHILPSPVSHRSFSKTLVVAAQIYHAIGRILGQKKKFTAIGEEGGFVPNLYTNADALDLISQAIGMTPFQLGTDVFVSLDIAATTFYENGRYSIKDRTTPISSQELLDYYKDLTGQYRIFSLEDPFAEDDWSSWTQLVQTLGSRIFVVGDDLVATNKDRLARAVKERAINAVIIKPNQIGTITETLEVIALAREAGLEIIVSHRAGETNDAFIADFAVGVAANFVKFGALVRGERVAKYNRLLEIESQLHQAV